MRGSALILLVEDNEANVMLAQAVLERDGFDVEVATNSAEAREWLLRVIPDLILMDVQLGGEDGIAFTQEIKANPKTRAIPIVAVTAHAMAGDRARAIHAGCDGYVSKPLDTRTFGSQMRAILTNLRTRHQEGTALVTSAEPG